MGASLRLAEAVARHVPGDVQPGFPLAPWTSVRVGGAAQVYVRPRSPDALVALLKLLKEEGAPLSILGGGANTLVGDGGVEGAVVKLPSDWFGEEAGDFKVTLPAGAAIARLVSQMKANGWVGAEFLAGIPGTLGGAVSMNAGTKHGECMSVVEAVELATADGTGWVSGLPYVYRHTAVPPGAVVTRVRFRLRPGDTAASQRQMDEDLAYRKRTQPLSQPSFGSVFRNPPLDHAGRLIEQVGLKGHTQGGAQISRLHANWIVNLGSATARDVIDLMALAHDRVRDAFGISLTPEVRRMGRFT